MSLIETRKGKPTIILPDIGKKGDPLAPVVQAFRERGIPVSPDAITQLRGETTSGAEIRRAAEAAEIVRLGRVPNKDAFFAQYGASGIEKRTEDRPITSAPSGLRMKLASELGVPGDILGDLVRALRIDLFYTPVDQLGASFRTNFRQAVEAYLRNLKRSGKEQEVAEIKQEWKRAGTAKNFYRSLLHQPRVIVAAWTPYEIMPIWALATNRLRHHSPLTPFDTMVLMGIDGDRSDRAIVTKIKADIGITVPRQLIDGYRALLMGRVTTKAQSTDQLSVEA